MRLSVYVTKDIADEVRSEQGKKGGVNFSKLFQEAFNNRKEEGSNYGLLKQIQQLKRKLKRIRAIVNQGTSQEQ